ncbi:MAG: hypothetical protein JWN69_585, partial [Alphaproteobacteria bacterium]|nr:hypothetical protein [Alphaproteobacteria bacterium]
MKRSRNKLLLLAGGALLVVGLPAASQEAPESLLPPGFGSNELPPHQPDRPGADRPDLTAAPSLLPPVAGGTPIGPDGTPTVPVAEAEPPKPLELPDWARRSTAVVGALDPRHGGLGGDEFGRTDGRFLSTLMRRLDAPIASRWASILLRRSLMSRIPVPNGVSPADWVGERAWLLLRMGEADGARLLVQAVDVDQFTPKMLEVAVQTALATADPAALCPLVEPGRTISNEPVWQLSEAMCAALAGDPAQASALIDQARRRSRAGGIDLLLAEKVIGAGTNTRRAVTIQWDEVDRLNSWRFGLASATGVVIPERLMKLADPRMQAWQARAPMLPLDQRLDAADTAATLGVFSHDALVEIYSLIADTTDPSEMRESIGGRLQQAYAGDDLDIRIGALRQLWDDAKTPMQRHARLLLTAGAAARLPANEAMAGDAGKIIASIFAAGLDQRAARWAEIVDNMGSDGDRAWALLAVGTPGISVDVSSGRIRDFAKHDDSKEQIRSKMLIAALAGLGRIAGGAQSLAENIGVHLAA